jgi:hypothetical protein
MDTTINEDTAVCEMIDLRRRVDKRLKSARALSKWSLFNKRLKSELAASRWPLFKVWQSTEALIFNIVAFCLILKDDGCTEYDAIKRLAEFSEQPLPNLENIDLNSYLKLRLQTADAEYMALGSEIFNKAVEIATTCAKDQIKKRKEESLFPPVAWLGAKIPLEKVAEYHNKDREWLRFQVRMKPDDEVRSFSGFAIPESNLSFRAGMALVRQGKPIEHLITVRS